MPLLPAVGAAPAEAQEACPAYALLGSRGSGQEHPDTGENRGLGRQLNDLYDKLAARLPAGSLELWANPYPAVPVPGQWYRYLPSVWEGQRNLHAIFNDYVENCGSRTQLILAGYSQGAHITGNVYEKLDAEDREHVLAVVLIGDPRFNGRSEAGRGDYDPRRNGLLTLFRGRREFPDVADGKVVSYCHSLDRICQGHRPDYVEEQHTNYHQVGDAASAVPYTERGALCVAFRAGHPGPSGPPVAKITPVLNPPPAPGKEFVLSAAQSWDPACEPLTYSWNLDGAGYGPRTPSPLHTTTLSAGSHTVVLKLRTASGEEATDTLTVQVVEPGEVAEPPEAPTAVVSTPAPDGSSATLTWQPPARGPPPDWYTVATTDGIPLFDGPSTGARSLTLPADQLPVTVVVTARNRWGESPPSTPVTMAATEMVPGGDLNALWRAYGDAGGHWTGGDRTVSIELPDERIAWLFSDTFLGTVNADHSRPRNSPLVHNTLVVQEANGQLGQTLHGGTASAPTSLVEVAGSDLQYWVGDGHVAGDQLQVLYNTYRVTGAGALDVELTGTSLVTFSLPALTVSDIQALPLGDSIAWGSSVLDDGVYTYIYGSEDADGDGARFAHVARVGRGDLGGAWEFFDGTDWSPDEADSARLLRGVGTAYDVVPMGDEYVLVTQDSNLVFSYAFAAYTADTPVGPFSGPTYLFEAPREYPGKPVIVYDAHVHTAFNRAGRLTISYNVNSLNPEDNYTDARIYRPRFVAVDWPRPQPDPATLPGPPRDLTGTVADDGVVHLDWNPPPNGGTGLTYRIYQRDVTAHQDNFARYEHSPTETAVDLPLLKDGHTYEFRVTAQNSHGEGPPSNTATVEVDLQPPPAPRDLQATATGNGQIRLDWEATSSNVLHTVYERDVTAEEPDFHAVPFPNPSDTTLTVGPLEHGHEYEYKVTARHGGGESGPSNLARATARWPRPPTPTGLTAQSRPNGDIILTWNEPAEGLWYWVEMRDITDPEQEPPDFDRIPIPATTTSWTGAAAYLEQDHLYEFRVLSTNQGGDSDPTAPVEAWSRAIRPPTPTGLAAESRPNGDIVLTWDAPDEGLWYLISMRDVTPGHEEEDFTENPIPVTTTSWTATAGYLQQDHVYEFKVASTSRGGKSDPTEPVQARSHTVRPLTPTGLTAVSEPNGDITLRWDAPAEGLWYLVSMRDVTAEEEDFTENPIPVVEGTTWTAQAGYLQVDHVYEFRVKSTNRGGESDPTAPVQAASHWAVPAAPTGVTAEAGDGEVALTWTAPSSPGVWYWVYFRNVSAGETEFTKGGWPATEPHVTMGWLANGDIYEFKVTAFNPGGESPFSNVVQARPLPPRPGPPTNLTATANNDGSITLTWTDPGPNLWYWVYRRDVTAREADFTKLGWPLTAGSTWIHTGLEQDHVYEFKLSAINIAGEGPLSNVASATAHYDRPGAPTNLRAVSSGNGEVTLNWDAPGPGPYYYWISMRDVTAGQTQFTRGGYPTDQTTARWGLLADGHTYEFKVSAENLGGEGPASSPVRVVARAILPAPPTNLRATAGSGVVVLNWTASPTPNVWYSIYYREQGSGQAWQRNLYGAENGTTYTVEYLINGRAYEFMVTATDWAGDSPPSNVVTATPRYPQPAPPTNLTATPLPMRVRLQWTPSTTAGVWYWVEYRDVSIGGGWQRLPLPLTGGTSFDFADGLQAHDYEFRLRSTNAGGDSVPSNVARTRPQPPLPPSGLTATPGVARVTLRWTASPSQPVWYWLEWRDATIGQPWQRGVYPVTSGTTATIEWLQGHRYEFRVRSTSWSGDSIPSNVVSATPLPPAPPSGLTATPQPNQVLLRWNASPTPNVWYWIEYRDATVNGGWERILYTGANGTSWTMLYLRDHVYQFRVRATGLSGDSVPSNTVSAQPLPPLPPSMLFAESGDARAFLTWRASPTPNVMYWVYYRDVTSCECTAWQRLTYPTSNTWMDVRYLFNARVYQFKVTAASLAGESGSTNFVYAYPYPPFPQPPTGVWGQTLQGAEAIRIQWNPSPTPNVRYQVWGRNRAGGGYFLFGEAGCCHLDRYHLRAGNTYDFHVDAVDYLGRRSAPSNTGSARAGAPRATFEEHWWGMEMHLSRQGTREFIQLAALISGGMDACQLLFQWLWLPGRVLSTACGIAGTIYEAMGNAARAYNSRGNCATINFLWIGIPWANEDAFATENCG